MKPSHEALLMRAAEDTSLSLKGRGLLTYLVVNCPDTIPAASDLAKVLPEGRDALQAASRELLHAGYLGRRTVRTRAGQTITETWLVTVTETGFPGAGDSGSPTRDIAITEQLISNHSEVVVPTEHMTTTATSVDCVTDPHFVRVSPAPAARGKLIEIGMEGAEVTIGAMPEANDREKVHVVGAPKWDRRSQKSRDKWTAREIMAEFTDLMEKHKISRTGQITYSGFMGMLSQWKRDNVTPEAIVAGIHMFFDEPRQLADVGDGKPLWVRFRWFFQTHQGRAARAAGVEKDDMQALADEVIATGKVKTWGTRDF